jgi:putative tricarboxylic transport membrane protein
MRERAGELLVSAAVLALGFALALAAYWLADAPGYAQVGPRLFPGLVAAGLILVGALLAKEALAGGFRHPPDDPRGAFDAPAFAWISAALIAQMLLIAGLGFIVASTILFAASARAFGSLRLMRDAALGLALGAVVYLVFTRGLTLSLPWGRWLP